MRKSLKEIASLIEGEVVGNSDTIITGVCGIKEACEGDITFLANPKYAPFIEKTRASAIITSRQIEKALKPIVRTQDPSLAFARILTLIAPDEVSQPQGVHPTALIGKNVSVGKDAAIGPYAVIEDSANIGGGTVVHAGCFIGHHSKVGSDCIIYPNVSIRERISIGNWVIIHSGTVIGSDGFGFAKIRGSHHKIPQIGTVVIEDNVEIGANVTIDRARFDKTFIGRGTKIDNLVQIAHNVIIGEDSIIVAQAGISGSTTIGKNVTLAGQAGLVGHITVGDGAIAAAQAGVTKSIPANTLVSGYPAKPHAVAKKVNACVQNLPKLYDMVSQLKKKIEELEKKLKVK